MSPFMGFSMMDDFFQGNGRTGYSSFQSINASVNQNVGNGAVKRTSTSTTFSNGKKITTKRYLIIFFNIRMLPNSCLVNIKMLGCHLRCNVIKDQLNTWVNGFNHFLYIFLLLVCINKLADACT